MSRLAVIASILSVLSFGLLTAGAEDEKPKGPPRLATSEEVAEALAQFKVDFKARGIPKEDVVSQRGWAMKKIATLHHPEVVQALAKVTKHRNKDLRTLSLIYLGDQTLHPYLAAKPILAAMKKHKRDKGMLMTGLQSLCLLRYLGARKEIAALLKHKEFAVKKLAITTVGAIGDIRMLKEILLILGVDVDVTSSHADGSKTDGGPNGDNGSSKNDSSKSGPDSSGGDSSGGAGESDGGSDSDGGSEDAGYSWDGVDVFVPEGEDAEAAVRAAQEKNRSAAEAAARGSRSSGGGAAPAKPAAAKPAPKAGPGAAPAPSGKGGEGPGLSGGSQRGGGQPARGSEELIPTILLTLRKLTGQKFSEPGSIKQWVSENATQVRARQRTLDKAEKAQKDAPKKAERAAKKKAQAEKDAKQKEGAQPNAGN